MSKPSSGPQGLHCDVFTEWQMPAAAWMERRRAGPAFLGLTVALLVKVRLLLFGGCLSGSPFICFLSIFKEITQDLIQNRPTFPAETVSWWVKLKGRKYKLGVKGTFTLYFILKNI